MSIKLQCTLVCLLLSFNVFSQIGIGTTTPNAQLEIHSSSDSFPALEINPQVAPIGTATGQLSVIGDQLYLYDSTRAKWLSVESSTLTFGKDGNSNNTNLEYAGDITKSGPKMARKGTIVYVTMNSSGGDTSKIASIEVVDNLGAVTSHQIQLVNGSNIYDNFNVDFEEGDHIEVNVSNAGTAVSDLAVVLWVKWRN